VRIREGILAVVLAAALASGLAACTDDSGDSSPTPTGGPVSAITVDCAKYADTAKKITDAQTALYADTSSTEAIDSLVTELTALKDKAPADIQAALTDMEAAFRDAQQILEHPTPENKAKLADLSPKLSDDGQKITAYITSECD
jgi:hypothetical protein